MIQNITSMEFNWLICFVSSIIVYFLILLIQKHTKTGGQPPAPPGWPVVGNLFSLGSMPHRTMAGLAPIYGPIVRLKLGSVNIVVILSTKAATELFKNHDLTFIDRATTKTNKSHGFNQSSFAMAPYGNYWRMLRKICTVEMFVAKRINESVAVRRRCVDNMLNWIKEDANLAKIGTRVHVTKFVFLASFNLLGNLILSRDMANPDSKLGSEFFMLMSRLMELGGHPNISDFYPWLKQFDLQGLRRKLDQDTGKAIEIVTGWVEERLGEQRKEVADDCKRRKDFLDVLLDNYEVIGIDEQENMSKKDIIIFILEIFLAATETTSSTIE